MEKKQLWLLFFLSILMLGFITYTVSFPNISRASEKSRGNVINVQNKDLSKKGSELLPVFIFNEKDTVDNNHKIEFQILPTITIPVGQNMDQLSLEKVNFQTFSNGYYYISNSKQLLTHIKLEGFINYLPDTSRVGQSLIEILISGKTLDGTEVRGIVSALSNIILGDSTMNKENSSLIDVKENFHTSTTENSKSPTISMSNSKTDTNPKFPWVSSYDKWENSETAVISKNNTFSVAYFEGKTKIKSTSTNALLKPGYKPGTYTYKPGTDLKEIVFSNVGYFEGKMVNLKVSWKNLIQTPENPVYDGDNYIGISGENFLLFSFSRQSGGLDVTYEFQDEDGEPLEISGGFWEINGLAKDEKITFDEANIQNVYSALPTTIQYENSQNKVSFMGTWTVNESSGPALDQFTIVYPKTSQIHYTYEYLDHTTYLGYYFQFGQNTKAMVEMPDPQGITNVYDEITVDNYPDDKENKIASPLLYQFVQHIPYQPSIHRVQNMEWKISNFAENPTLKTRDWQIFDETGQNVVENGLFTVNEDKETGETIITAKDISANELYNHYFTFQRIVVIDDTESIQEDLLLPSSSGNGKYLNDLGTVSLKVNNLEPVTSDFQTSINFAANINYYYKQYVDGKLVGFSEDPIDVPHTGDGLITHDFLSVIDEEKQETIAVGKRLYDLILDQTIPLQTEFVRYSQENVDLAYQAIDKVFITKLPKELSFGLHELSADKTVLPQVDDEWTIEINNQRSNSSSDISLYASMTEFTDSNGNELPASLQVNEVEIPVTSENSTGLPIRIIKDPSLGINNVTWTKNNGFKLIVNSGKVRAANYSADVTFSILDAPND